MVRFTLIFFFFVRLSFSQDVIDLNDRANVIKKIQKDRIENLLPRLMKETDIDMWIIITREYNEDPIIKTFLPPTWLNARRRTILVFYYDKSLEKLEKAAISRYNFGQLLTKFECRQ